MQEEKKKTQHQKRLALVFVLSNFFLFRVRDEEFFELQMNADKASVLKKVSPETLKQVLCLKEYLISRIEKCLKKGGGKTSFTLLASFEQALLLTATYEILYLGLKKAIVIDEAVIIAKKFRKGKVFRFVN